MSWISDVRRPDRHRDQLRASSQLTKIELLENNFEKGKIP